jgi:crotonobetainyl-CoA:carnitine CoA-transferase CaiB-like acyl-CoA transferase
MAVTGEEETGPLRVGYPVCDTVAGLTAAFAIAAALYEREATGAGRQLDVSMFDATLVTLGWPVSNWMIAGVEPKRMGNQNATASPSGTFRTREGMLNIAANKQSQYEALCNELGVPELVADPRFAQREARKQNRELLQRLLESALEADTAQAWEARLNRAGVPAGRVLSIPQALAHPQVAHRRLTTELRDVPGVERPVAVMGAGFLVDGNGARVGSPPANLGQHTQEVLGELGVGADEVERLRREGAL